MTEEQGRPANPASFALSRVKMLVFLLLFVGISVSVTYTLYMQLQGQVRVPLSEFASWPLLLSLLVLLLVYFASDGLRLFFILRALGYRIPIRGIVPLVFINLLVSNITPMATGGGVAQVWYLRRYHIPIGVATAATTLRTLLAVVFIFIPTPLLLLSFEALSKAPLLDHFSVYLAGLACVYLGFFAVVLLKMRWLAAGVFALIRLLGQLHIISHQRIRHWRYKVMREMVHFSSTFAVFFRGSGLDIAASALLTFIFLLSLFSFPALILWGLGHPVSYPASVGFLVVTTFVMYFSPTPGAAGVAEMMFVVFFQHIVQPEYVLTAMVAWRFFTIYLGVLIGIPVTWKAVFARPQNA